ncbi:MAG: hypothetical protein F4207_13525 [Gemmatimonadetes bacterium]|nr:hypothetical protein [Gemmatimonadota bacterium]MYA76632.1 hypothetical protein [Gemmatimonadota bacterium]MYG17420.1 hypothetical protein [Gemmatimonadota bacterium]MYH19791.1 hypothetical protein [Gemmatimonadota bacterium]
MRPTIYIGVVVLVVLLLSAFSCHSPKRSVSLKWISQDEFERLTESEDSYGYRGSGNIQWGAQLGHRDIDLGVMQITVDSARRSVKIAGYVLDNDTREPLPNSYVAIGTVEYDQDGFPCKILAKREVVSGVNGIYVIESVIEPGDRLFGAHDWYIVKVYDVYKLIYPP